MITNAQTTITYLQLRTLLMNDEDALRRPGIDFGVPVSRALPKYAKVFSGTYYEKASQVSSPTAFSTPYKTTPEGNFYEEALPTDCCDNGVSELLIFNAAEVVPNVNVQNVATIQTWDTSS